ncbi:MAG: ArnT family glycosyltransferase, partial [Streptosporangiaceae bacterium]
MSKLSTRLVTRRSSVAAVEHREAPATGPGLGAVTWWSAGLVTLALLALASRYGYHRDELYFRIAGQHLAFGYVDQPPFTPLVARIETILFGDNLLAMRVWPALVAGGCVVISALVCRELGGGRRAQAVVSVGIAVSPGVLLAGHLLVTATTDLLVWQLIAFCFIRLLRTQEPRRWLLLGVVVGVGLENKDLPAFLAVALLAGLVLAGQARLMVSRWFAAGVAVAGVIALPDVVWQFTHGVPEVSVAQAQRGGTSLAQYVVFQLIIVNPALIPMQVRGVRRLWAQPRYRSLVWAFALLEVFFLLVGGKPYYPAAFLLVLVAAGAAGTASLGDSEPGKRRSRVIRYASIGVLGALLAPAVLPILPVRTWANSAYAGEQDQEATVGWPQVAAQMNHVIDALPARQRAHAIVLTSDYSEAGALSRYGSSGLPVFSGHNALWYYGTPPASAATTVVVGYGLHQASRWLLGCRQAGTNHPPYGLDDGEQGTPLLVCASPRQPWA